MLVAGRVFNTHTIERRTVLTANTKATNFILMITIPQIIFFFLSRNVSPENIPDRSVFGKAYHQWLNSEWFFPADYSFKPISLNGVLLPYELQFCLSNAGDCADWLADNGKKLNDFIVPKITLTENKTIRL